MRIAVFADIHGNSVALEAVLADIERQGGADHYWVLGDLIAPGVDPIGVLERLNALPNVQVIRGNADRYVYQGDRPRPTLDEARANPDLIPIYTEVASGFAWALGALAFTPWIEWLQQLPYDLRMTLPDGTRMYGVHASPRHDMDAVYPYHSEEEKMSVAALTNADLVFCGHIHWQWETRIGDVHWINTGSIGNPVQPHLEATYVLLDADEDGYAVTLCQTPYDRQKVIDMGYEQRHPAADFLARFLTGEFISNRMEPEDADARLWNRD